MSNAGIQNASIDVPAAYSGSFVLREGGDGSPAVPGATAIVSADLLFSGAYNRTGPDLTISNGTYSTTIHDYFKGEHRPVLMSPEGASLSGNVVEAITGRLQYAQADQIASAVLAVGNVVKLMGTAVVTRSGVSVELKQGDRLLKGDVIQSGADTTVAMSFIDGTALGLASNARVVLDEMIYDPNGSSNSSLMSLVQGTITLVAGHTAKFGNMRVETPVATMGIRGTAVLVEIVAENGPTKFSVLKEPDGRTGFFQLYDKVSGDLMRTVSHAGLVTFVSPAGAGQPMSAVDQLKTMAEFQTEKALIQDVFKISFPQYNPDGPLTSRTGSSQNALADASGRNTGQTIAFDVPALIALASAAAVIPMQSMAQDDLVIPAQPAAPVVIAIAVENVFDVQAEGAVDRSFAISDQVTVTRSDGEIVTDASARYVAGTGVIAEAEATAPIPEGVNLANLVDLDPATGVVTYDPGDFTFLGTDESAVYTIAFDSKPGASVVPEKLTLTINGLNDSPVVEHQIPDQHVRNHCRFEYIVPACTFADLDANDILTYRATLANGDPLPCWLTFDPVTLTFSGKPPEGECGILHLKVIASDGHGGIAVDKFDLVIHDEHHHHHHRSIDDDQMRLASQDQDTVVGGNSNELTDASAGSGVTCGDACSHETSALQLNKASEIQVEGLGSEDRSGKAVLAANDSGDATLMDHASVSSTGTDVSFNAIHGHTSGIAKSADGASVFNGLSVFNVSLKISFSDSLLSAIDTHAGSWHGASGHSNGSHFVAYNFSTASHMSMWDNAGHHNHHQNAFASSHMQIANGPAADGFVFKSDFGRDTANHFGSVGDFVEAQVSRLVEMVGTMADVQRDEGLHDQVMATSVSLAETHAYQSDFRFI